METLLTDKKKHFKIIGKEYESFFIDYRNEDEEEK